MTATDLDRVLGTDSSIDVSNITANSPTASGPFLSFGDQLRAVANASLNPNRPVDRRLLEVQKRAATNPIGASIEVPTDGGFLVQPEFTRQIIKRVYQTGEIFKRCMVVPTNSNTLKIPQFDEGSRVAGSRLGGVEGYWENEGETVKPSNLWNTSASMKPSFNNIELGAKKVTFLLHLTDELSMDSNAFSDWATYAASQELMFKLEGAVVGGSGAGQPLGILNSPALAQIAPQAGQASHTVNSQNISTMLASFWASSYQSAGSVWLYNQQLLPQLAALQTLVGVAGSQSNLWQWCQSDDDYDRLCGFPALPCEFSSVPGTIGDILLVDLSRYLIGMREFRGDVSIHVLFLSDQSTFRWVMRCDGQPLDRSPVTPLNGNVPTTPFVALTGR